MSVLSVKFCSRLSLTELTGHRNKSNPKSLQINSLLSESGEVTHSSHDQYFSRVDCRQGSGFCTIVSVANIAVG